VDLHLSILWYILWKADFDILVMSKKFDLLQLEVITLKGRESLTEAHSHMSQWFSLAWDQSHTGFLDWHDFSNGWMIATQGGDNEVCSLLFNAIDRDNDKYISLKDVIEYCRLALSNVQSISMLSIETTVKVIFEQMKRTGPFDVINIQNNNKHTQLPHRPKNSLPINICHRNSSNIPNNTQNPSLEFGQRFYNGRNGSQREH